MNFHQRTVQEFLEEFDVDCYSYVLISITTMSAGKPITSIYEDEDIEFIEENQLNSPIQDLDILGNFDNPITGKKSMISIRITI